MNLYRVTMRRDGERRRENGQAITEIITEEIYYAAESIGLVWAVANEAVRADYEREIVGIAEVVGSIVILKGEVMV